MPAPTHPRPHTETLANGLRVTLRHVPGLKRSAAALRVAAGSHDVPLAWPGWRISLSICCSSAPSVFLHSKG